MNPSLAQIMETLQTQIQAMSEQIKQVQKIVEKNSAQQPGVNPVLAKNLQRIHYNMALMAETSHVINDALKSLGAEATAETVTTTSTLSY